MYTSNNSLKNATNFVTLIDMYFEALLAQSDKRIFFDIKEFSFCGSGFSVLWDVAGLYGIGFLSVEQTYSDSVIKVLEYNKSVIHEEKWEDVFINISSENYLKLYKILKKASKEINSKDNAEKLKRAIK